MTKHLRTAQNPTGVPVERDAKLAQVAALCYRIRAAEGREVLLITSRETARWVLPKGWPIEGLDAAGAALQEAWEEAGVRGVVGGQPLGSFDYLKRLDDGNEATCRTQVFPVAVETLSDDFPESHERQRKWVSPTMAAAMVEEPGLQRILRDFQTLKL